jgi:hypothetical protein
VSRGAARIAFGGVVFAAVLAKLAGRRSASRERLDQAEREVRLQSAERLREAGIAAGGE